MYYKFKPIFLTSLLFLVFNIFVNDVIATGVKVLEWKFDENNGLTAYDSVGSNHGTLQNFPDPSSNRQWVPGLVGNCLFFDERVHDTVVKLNATGLPTRSFASWSINMYVLIHDAQLPVWTAIGGFGTCTTPGQGRGERSLINWSNGIYFWTSGTDLDCNTAFDINRWQMLTATYNGTTLKVYKNGTLIASGSRTLATASAEVHLGWAGPGGRFNGMIDEFTIWQGDLTQTQIDTLATTLNDSINPFPVPYSNNAETAPVDTVLSWDDKSESYDVYFGTDFNDVNNANHSSSEFKGNQTGTTYAPCGLLNFGKKYFWRIDQINSGNAQKGSVFSFVTTVWQRNVGNMTANHTLSGPRIVYEPGTIYPYKMWLWGWPSLTSPYYGTDSIYMARSQNLDSCWQFYKGSGQWDNTGNPDLWVPVVTNGSGFYNNQGNGDQDVTKYGDYYYMAYSAVGKDLDGYQRNKPYDTDGSIGCVMFAKSLDGINWTLSNGPILIYEPEIGVLENEADPAYKGLYHMPSLLHDGDRWRVWFHFWHSGSHTGYAECLDTNDPLEPSSWRIINGMDNELNVPSYPDVEKIGGTYYSFITNYYYSYSNVYGLRELNTKDALSFTVADSYIPTDEGYSIERPSALHIIDSNYQSWVYVFYSDTPVCGDSGQCANILATYPHPVRYMKHTIDMPYAVGPKPCDGAAGIDVTADISWLPGDKADSHDVYFGTSYNAVAAATHSFPEFMGNQAATIYHSNLALNTTYYWRVDEINDVEGTWHGNIWKFTTGSGAAKVLEWKMDESSGTTASDSVGSNDGTAEGCPNWVTGLSGNCLQFDGVDDRVEKLSAAGLPMDANNSWSINMYLYMDSVQPCWTAVAGFGDDICPGDSKGERYLVQYATTNNIYFWTEGGGDINTGVGYTLGNWQMITVTYDGLTCKVYKATNPNNVTLISSGTMSLNSADGEVHLAWPAFGNYYQGKIDEFTIWNGVLTQGQINQLANILSIQGDINGDGVVDIEDMEKLINAWLTEDNSVDLNHDTFVNFKDFAILAEKFAHD
jgi:hypothetical protein